MKTVGKFLEVAAIGHRIIHVICLYTELSKCILTIILPHIVLLA